MFTCWLGRFCQSQLFLGWLIKRSNLWLIKAPPDNTVLSFNHLLSLYENQTSKWLNLFFFFFFCQSRKEWKKEIKKKKVSVSRRFGTFWGTYLKEREILDYICDANGNLWLPNAGCGVSCSKRHIFRVFVLAPFNQTMLWFSYTKN